MPLRIIVADRDRSTTSVLNGFFAPALVEFAPADSAADLKKAIKSQTPSLILLDPLLPDVPNWQAAQKIIAAIKNSREYKSVPVIALGGDPDGPDLAQLRSLGADAYLNKPLEKHPTVSTIESFLKSSQPSPAEEDDEDIVIDFGDDDDDYSEPSVSTEEDPTPPEESLAMPETLGEQNAIQDLPVAEDERGLDVVRQSDGAYDLQLDPNGPAKPHEVIDSLEASLLDYDMRGQERSTDLNEVKPDSDQSLLEFFEREDEPTEEAPLQWEQEAIKSIPDKVRGEAEALETFFGDSDPPTRHDDLEEIRSELTQLLPEKSEVLEQIRQAISEAFPTRGEVLQRLDMHLEAMVPLKKEVLDAVASRKPDTGNEAEDELTIRDMSLSDGLKDKSSGSGVDKFFLRSHGHPSNPDSLEKSAPCLQEEPSTIDAMVKTILREKIEEMLPEPNQILSWFREEIDRLVLDTAEKIIRQRVEEITSDPAR